MRTKLLLFLMLLFLAVPLNAQTKKGFKATLTAHGMLLTWTAPATVGGSGTIASYNIYRCPGTCTLTSGAFTMLTGQIPTILTYLDPAGGLTSGSTYTWAVTTVDSAGNESAYSPFFTIAFTAITNPNAPGSLTGVNK